MRAADMLLPGQIDKLMEAWDKLHNAMVKVECALPLQMSLRVKDMSGERIDFRHRFQTLMRQALADESK